MIDDGCDSVYMCLSIFVHIVACQLIQIWLIDHMHSYHAILGKKPALKHKFTQIYLQCYKGSLDPGIKVPLA